MILCRPCAPPAVFTMNDSTIKTHEKAEAKSSPEESPIQTLPTELLVFIFSWLSIQDLGHSVPRVCKRWREALCFRTLWTEKELVYEYGQEDLFLFVLGVAPCLSKLTINPMVCKDPSAIVTSIRKGPKDVKNLHYNLSLFPSDTAARILSHYKEYVCELHLVGHAYKQSSIYRNLSNVLGQMSQLKTLVLSGYFDTKWDKEVLENGCLRLDHLDISHMQDESDSYLPFLDSVKPYLKSLKLPHYKPNLGVLGLVPSCSELKEITLCLDDLRCIGSLQSLESLHIKWSDGVPKNKIIKFVRSCPVFINLKELTLHYIPGSLASEIAKRCLNLKALNMHGITSCTKIIKAVPSLKELRIVDRLSLRMRHVQKLPRYLPNLTYLDLEGSFVDRGIPPKIISQLKNQLPGLSIKSDPFVSYSKQANKGYFTKCTDSSTDCSSDEA